MLRSDHVTKNEQAPFSPYSGQLNSEDYSEDSGSEDFEKEEMTQRGTFRTPATHRSKQVASSTQPHMYRSSGQLDGEYSEEEQRTEKEAFRTPTPQSGHRSNHFISSLKYRSRSDSVSITPATVPRYERTRTRRSTAPRNDVDNARATSGRGHRVTPTTLAQSFPRAGASPEYAGVQTPNPSDDTTLPISDTRDSILTQILKEVKCVNMELRQKVTSLEEKVEGLHGPSVVTTKVKPSCKVRDAVRKVYKSLCDGDENFSWNLHDPLRSRQNKDIVQKLVAETKVYLPDSTSAEIKEAAKTYFSSMVGTNRLKSSGKYAQKKINQRRRNRLLRKLKTRKVVLQKTKAVAESEKPKWSESLLIDLMSSEESEDDGSFTVHPLPWRSEKATDFMYCLDNKHEKKQSRKSRVMTYERHHGSVSDRPKPGDAIPAWCIR